MFKLRPYQQEAVDRTIQYFRKSKDPALIVLPTGAGKSIVISELARKAKGRVLVLAHVKELVEQNAQKYMSYGLEVGIYSAGIGLKQTNQKVIFGSIQSVARASSDFFNNFNLLIIDECHRVEAEGETQYATTLKQLKNLNPHLCILGLTATPYRLGHGWIYQHHFDGEVKTTKECFFKHCLYELTLQYMIKNGFLTRPVKVDLPVTSYDFSQLNQGDKHYSASEIEKILSQQKRLTPLIIQNIIEITEKFDRKGVMIFSSTVNHAKEILQYMPQDQTRLIVGDTDISEREKLITEFKEKKFKYLVNVSVLTTGFDAPHVDVIAILRPTESVSLYQQIIGRGLRLSEGKKDCFILDYTGMPHDIYSPEIADRKPSKEAVPVLIPCPKCEHANYFWGYVNHEGEVMQHFGRKCKGAIHDPETLEITECGHRFRFKICHECQTENDIGARECEHCKTQLIDADSKLKQARLSKDAHILKPENMEFIEKKDKNGNSFLEVKYFDTDAQHLSEAHFLNNQTARTKFNINFLRSHAKRPELLQGSLNLEQVMRIQNFFRKPSYIIARKKGKFWRITEKIFQEELEHGRNMKDF